MPGRLRAMTPDAFAAAVTQEEERPDRIILSTRHGFVPHPLSPIRHLLGDNHLRAVIDPGTGSVRYEIHQSTFDWGALRSYVSAYLPAPGGERRAELLESRPGERFCPNEDDWGQCALTQHIVFAIGEEELRAIAAGYHQDEPSPWRYRIEEAAGRHWHGALSPAEAAGLLMAAERRLRAGA